MAPCSLCSRMYVRLCSKLGSSSCGMAIRNWSFRESLFMPASIGRATGCAQGTAKACGGRCRCGRYCCGSAGPGANSRPNVRSCGGACVSAAAGEGLLGVELPGADDFEDIDVLAHFCSEGRKRRCQPHALDGGLVQERMAGGLADLDIAHRAVRQDLHQQAHAAELVFTQCLLGEVARADHFDFTPERIDIQGFVMRLGRHCRQGAYARAFCVSLFLFIEASLQAGDFLAEDIERFLVL